MSALTYRRGRDSSGLRKVCCRVPPPKGSGRPILPRGGVGGYIHTSPQRVLEKREKQTMGLHKSKRVARGRAEAPAVFRKPTKPVKRTHGVPLAKCMAYLLRNTWPTKLEIFDKADFCRVQQIRTQIRNIRQGCVKSTCISIANPAIVRAKDAQFSQETKSCFKVRP